MAKEKKANIGHASPVKYIVCILIAVICIFPFVLMLVNATRSSIQIKDHPVSLIPSKYLMDNLEIIQKKKTFDAVKGFLNSLIIAGGSTLCAVYFSSLTAYSVVVYDWKLRRAFFTFIMCVLMIPGQVVSIGYYQFIYKIGMTNNFLPLIIPSIAAPGTVFFLRQYMLPSLSIEIIQSARIDGAREFRIFNSIALPILKPAIATQAIFSFVNSWNQLFLPSVLLTKAEKRTMPIMVSLLKGDIYKVEFGVVYLGLTLTVLPLFVVYFALSKYIVAGVALGSVKG